MDTHISFLTKYSGPHNCWVFHHNLARFGRCGRCGKTRVHSFPSQTQREGRGARGTHSRRHWGGVSGWECIVPGWYSSAPPSYISHIATFSAKQESPRCKWHRSIIWRRGWLEDQSVYYFIKSQLETQRRLPRYLSPLLLSILLMSHYLRQHPWQH